MMHFGNGDKPNIRIWSDNLWNTA